MALDANKLITINWDCDCADQSAVVSTLLTDVAAQDAYLLSIGRKQMQIFSPTAPSTARWQTQWLSQGGTLPIPTGVECLWYDTSINLYGAQYYVISGIPRPVEMLMYRGIKNPRAVPDVVNNFSTPLDPSVTGLSHWSITGTLQAAEFRWNIPTHLIGKNYFVKFTVPFGTLVSTIVNWTIWYETTNFYNTLFGGAGEAGFGVFPVTGSINKTNVIEWIAEIPAGGVGTTIAIRIASNTSPGANILVYPNDGGGNLSAGLTGAGRVIAEFILKTE